MYMHSSLSLATHPPLHSFFFEERAELGQLAIEQLKDCLTLHKAWQRATFGPHAITTYTSYDTCTMVTLYSQSMCRST